MIFTKSTRVAMSPSLLDEITAWPEDKKLAELQYMANTIPSSWEFCDYTFMVEGVTRALTHQLVRHRHMSFAQQTMQILDMSQGPGWTYEEGPSLRASSSGSSLYQRTMENVAKGYALLVKTPGVRIEDARGVLPTNIHTNIVVKANMRSLVELFHKRDSPRNLWEISALMDLIKAEVLKAHSWMDLFINRTFDQAAKDLDKELRSLDGVAPDKVNRMMKLVDQMRMKSS
jgi:flavin-dependent thymidylate synthase